MDMVLEQVGQVVEEGEGVAQEGDAQGARAVLLHHRPGAPPFPDAHAAAVADGKRRRRRGWGLRGRG